MNYMSAGRRPIDANFSPTSHCRDAPHLVSLAGIRILIAHLELMGSRLPTTIREDDGLADVIFRRHVAGVGL